MRRVVITGLGPVTPIGIGRESFLEGLLEGRDGIAPLTRFDTETYALVDGEKRPFTVMAGQVPAFDLERYGIDRKKERRADRQTHLALAAAQLALEDAQLVGEAEPLHARFSSLDAVAIHLGVGIGGIETMEERKLLVAQERGARRVSPFTIPALMPNAPAGEVSIAHGIRGEAYTSNAACAAAGYAIMDSARLIRLGEYDVVLTGGVEAPLTPLSIVGFHNMTATSTKGVSRPFDEERDGFIPAEGAGFLVLESLDHAVARGAPVLAEIIGYGASSDAYGLTAPRPDGSGMQHALRTALARAAIVPEQVGYVNAHGTSTPLNDPVEIHVLRECFGASSTELPVSSLKSQTGHLLGAAAGPEMIATTLALSEGLLPATINLEQIAEDCAGVRHIRTPTREQPEYAVKEALGFGGHNVALVAARYQ